MARNVLSRYCGFNHQTVYRLLFLEFFHDLENKLFQSPNGVQIALEELAIYEEIYKFQSPNGVQIALGKTYTVVEAIEMFQSPNGVQISFS